MLYLVLAHDHHDQDAPARRAAVREAHLEAVRPLAERGVVQVGGALLDDAGVMRGSMMLVEAESEAEVRDLVWNDVYVRERVWDVDAITIRPFARAV